MPTQKLALVNYQTNEIVHVFDEGTPKISVPDHGEVTPSLGLFIGQYQVWPVRLAQGADHQEMQGQPLYKIEPAGKYVYETAVFVEKKGA